MTRKALPNWPARPKHRCSKVSSSSQEFKQRLEALAAQLEQDLESAESEGAVEEARVRYLGRKGLISKAMADLRELPQEERPQAGQTANQVKGRVQSAVEAKLEAIAGSCEDGALWQSLERPR